MSSLHSTLKAKSYPSLKELNPGLKPMSFAVLVLSKVTEKQIGSIIIPEKVTEREDEAADEGMIVALGSMAGSELWAGSDKPTPGDVVLFKRYAGKAYVGDDGNLYRLMDDKEIFGARAAAMKAAEAA